jgi:hypothetical protein
MLLKRVSYSICLLLAACSEVPQRCPATKQWSRQEQIEIATERNILADSPEHPLFDEKGKRIVFTVTPAVLDDWERMRRELK